MKDDPHFGCGIYPLIFRGWPKYACLWHDKAYTHGSWAQSNLTREQTDNWFLKQMLLTSKNNPAKKAAAYTMYGIVRAVGWVFWENGKKVEAAPKDYDPQGL